MTDMYICNGGENVIDKTELDFINWANYHTFPHGCLKTINEECLNGNYCPQKQYHRPISECKITGRIELGKKGPYYRYIRG